MLKINSNHSEAINLTDLSANHPDVRQATECPAPKMPVRASREKSHDWNNPFNNFPVGPGPALVGISSL
jgi:hypothetical protein